MWLSFQDPGRQLARRWPRSIAGIILVIVLLMSLPLPLQASSRSSLAGYSITQWDIADGLPHNLPLSIAQDHRGRLWVGTWEGVARFDGHSFVTFDRRNADGAELEDVVALLPLEDDSLLAGSSKGIYRYQQGKWSLLHPGLKGVGSEVALRDRQGTFWFADATRLLSLDSQGSLRQVPLGDGPVQVFAGVQLADGRLLLGTEKGLFHLAGDRVLPWPPGRALAGVAVLKIQPDGDGWLLATPEGAWRLDGDNRLQPVGPRERVDNAVRGRDGTLWLNLHDGGFVAVDAKGRQMTLPIPGLRARSMIVDREGAVWSGTSQGLLRIAKGAAQALPGSEGFVRAVLEDADGSIWVASGEGLRQYIGGKVHWRFDRSVLALGRATDGDGIWAGTYDRGVIRYDGHGRQVQVVQVADGRTSGLVRAVLQTGDGTLWIGTAAMGLMRWRDGRLDRIGAAQGLPFKQVQALYPDPQGGLWIGSTSGMAHMDSHGRVRLWLQDRDLPASTVLDFLRDPDGTLWIASNRGLLRLSGGRIFAFDTTKGLPRDKIFRVLDDGRHLWLSSSRGVFRVARSDLAAVAAGRRHALSVAVVDHSDGMPGGQGNGGSWPAGWMRRDGTLLFPTAEGVGVIDVARVASRQLQSVPVQIGRVQIDGEPMDSRGRLSLSPDARRVVISFTGQAYQAPELVRYRYRLVGFDPDWVENGVVGQASFTSLPAGQYRLEVEAMSLPVDWADRSRVGTQSLSIDVQAPLWQHPLVIALAVGLALLLMYGLTWARLAVYRARHRRLNQIIAERTDELVEKNFALEAAGRERDALVQKLAHQATHDALTELPNRRAADGHLRAAMQSARRNGQELAVALIDLDHFKRINDTHGHEAGDRVLCEVGQRLRGHSGSDVFAARHGGEEFLVVMQGWPVEKVRSWLDALRMELSTRPMPLGDGQGLTCTISAGFAFLDEDGHSAGELLGVADARLYQAKKAGRNRIVG